MIYTIGLTKGGVGKTSSCEILGEIAQREGKRVLLIDLDSQCNLSFWNRADLTRPGSYEIITGTTDPLQAVQEVQNGLSIISGSANLAGLKTSRSSATRLLEALTVLNKRYNAIFIDTGPAMNEALYNAITAANRILIPLEADTNSLQALYQLTDVIHSLRESRPTITIAGAFITKFDARPIINRTVRDAIRTACEDAKVPYLGEVRTGICIREAQAVQEPFLQYAPKSRPAADYETIYREITKK